LRLFYAEERNKDEGNYSRSTLLRFRNGLERYLINPPYKRTGNNFNNLDLLFVL